MALASKWLWQRRMAHVKPFIESPVLDVGCGDGAASAHVTAGYVGVDRDLAPLRGRPSMEPSGVQGTADRLPFADGAFRTVLAMASLEHVDDPVACLAEARRVLAPGGRVVMTTPTPFGDRIHHWLAKIGITSKHAADEHQSVMDPRGLARAVEAAGLHVEYIKVFLFGGNQICVASAAAPATQLSGPNELRVSMVGSLPPQKGVSAYTRELCLSISQISEVDLDVVSFSSLYPRRLYPGGNPDRATNAPQQLPGVTVRRPLRWWNPIGWFIAGLTLRGKVVHAQWWSFPLAPVYAVLLGLARLRGKRVLLTVHNVEPHERGIVRRLANRAILPLAHHFIVHSEPNARALEARGVRSDRLSIVPIGVGEASTKDEQRQRDARARLGLAQDAPLALFLGNVRPYKGLDVLVEAFAIVRGDLPAAWLAVVGQPWQGAPDPLERIAQLGLRECTRVVRDYVSDEDMDLWLDACDVAVYPYTHFDAQSAAACDALRRGCAIIVSAVGGLSALVRDERAHVPPSDPTSLARALRNVLSDRHLRRQLEADSIEVARGLAWPNVANRTAGIYAQMLQGTRSRVIAKASTPEGTR